jgi:hypothetical protein
VCASRRSAWGAMVREEVWPRKKKLNPEGDCASVMAPPCPKGVGDLVAGSEQLPHGTGVSSHRRSATSRLYLRLEEAVVTPGSIRLLERLS